MKSSITATPIFSIPLSIVYGQSKSGPSFENCDKDHYALPIIVYSKVPINIKIIPHSDLIANNYVGISNRIISKLMALLKKQTVGRARKTEAVVKYNIPINLFI